MRGSGWLLLALAVGLLLVPVFCWAGRCGDGVLDEVNWEDLTP